MEDWRVKKCQRECRMEIKRRDYEGRQLMWVCVLVALLFLLPLVWDVID